MQNTLNQIRACKASKADGQTRCRNHATTEEGYCGEHKNCENAAPAPQIILFKARVNPKWVDRFERAGVRWQKRNDVALQERHTEAALSDGRKPNAVREERADSGTPVFGKDGAKFVSVEEVKNELVNADFRVTDVHLYRRPGEENMATIVVVMTTEPLETTPPTSETQAAAWKLVEKTAWEAAHVWANGPNNNGLIVHTINLCHRLPDTRPEAKLVYANGLWDLV